MQHFFLLFISASANRLFNLGLDAFILAEEVAGRSSFILFLLFANRFTFAALSDLLRILLLHRPYLLLFFKHRKIEKAKIIHV